MLLTVFVMEVLKDVKSTWEFHSLMNRSTFLIQRVRIGIRLGSQLITIVVVCAVAFSLFPSVPYAAITIPSISVAPQHPPSFLVLRPLLRRAPLVHPPRLLPPLVGRERLERVGVRVSVECSAGAEKPEFCPYSTTALSTAEYCVVRRVAVR